MRHDKPTVIQKAVLIGFLCGAFEFIMDMVGRSLSDRHATNLLVMGLGVLIIWILRDVSETLNRILEETRKR
jgi:hypothetical protein